MTITKRECEILNSINSCKRERYRRSEELTELLRLQQELVDIAFSGFDGYKTDLRITDVAQAFCRMNDQTPVVDDETMSRFVKQAKRMQNQIKSEIAGLNGERKIARELTKITCPKSIITNLELGAGIDHTEIDALIITPGNIFVAEVKNTNTDIFISDNGDYYKNGEFLKKKYNIRFKLEQRENLVNEILKTNQIEGYTVHKLLVFANDRITVQNKCHAFSHCFWTTLPAIIESYVSEDIPIDELEKIRIAFISSERKETYPMDFDAEQFKCDFAKIVALLEEKTSYTTTVKSQNEKRKPIEQPNQTKRAVGLKKVAAAIGFTVFPPAALLLLNKKVRSYFLPNLSKGR